jgi:hypothetical protein
VRPARRLGRRANRSEPAHGSAAYADWKPGTLVEHELYGVGQVLWIQPSPGQTRAGLRFAGYGDKTFILERAPIRKLERRSP